MHLFCSFQKTNAGLILRTLLRSSVWFIFDCGSPEQLYNEQELSWLSSTPPANCMRNWCKTIMGTELIFVFVALAVNIVPLNDFQKITSHIVHNNKSKSNAIFFPTGSARLSVRWLLGHVCSAVQEALNLKSNYPRSKMLNNWHQLSIQKHLSQVDRHITVHMEVFDLLNCDAFTSFISVCSKMLDYTERQVFSIKKTPKMCWSWQLLTQSARP